MPLLNNEYLNVQSFVKYVTKFTESGKPYYLQNIKKTIKKIYFQNDQLSDAEARSRIENDEQRFQDYLHLQSLLMYLLSSESIDLAFLKTFSEEDWQPNIEAHFAFFNNDYRYFDSNDGEVKNLFGLLAKASRAVIVLIEENNTPDDKMAYEYAYKMMALFVSDIHDEKDVDAWFKRISKEMGQLLKTSLNQKHHPYHDVLLTALELPKNIADRKGWIKLIQKEGVPVFKAFALANRIEEKNEGHAPIDLNQANTLKAQCNYQRASEDVAFAALCQFYQVSEQRFNRCLDYLNTGWPKKNDDRIPKVMVQYKTYTWSKLPSDDKRALILGDMTNCCQSIGGDSEQCVMDAVSLSNNGLYVLSDGKKIIGQSYVWLSNTGNLCLDSIECFDNAISGADLKIILTEFANQLFLHYPIIKRVTLGTGGKTPEKLFEEKTVINETMRQGFFYGDAKEQYLIAKQPLPLTQAQQKALNELLNPYPSQFRSCLDYLCHYLVDTSHFVSTLSDILKNYPDIITKISFEHVQLYMALFSAFNVNDLRPISFHEFQQLTPEKKATVSTAQLVWLNSPDDIVELLPFIPTDERFKVVTTLRLLNEYLLHPKKIKKIFNALSTTECVALARSRNISGQMLLVDVIKETETFNVLFNVLSTAERAEVVREKNRLTGETLLQASSSNLGVLKMLLCFVDPNERFAEMAAQGGRFSSSLFVSGCRNPALLKILLDALPRSDYPMLSSYIDGSRYEFLEYIKYDLNPISVAMILDLYTREECLTILNKEDSCGNTLLDYAVKYPDLLKMLVSRYFKEDFFIRLKKINSAGYSPLKNVFGVYPEELQTILELCPENERLALLKEKISPYNANLLEAPIVVGGRSIYWLDSILKTILPAVSLLLSSPQRMALFEELNQKDSSILLCMKQVSDLEPEITLLRSLKLTPEAYVEWQACKKSLSTMLTKLALNLISNDVEALQDNFSQLKSIASSYYRQHMLPEESALADLLSMHIDLRKAVGIEEAMSDMDIPDLVIAKFAEVEDALNLSPLKQTRH